MQTRDWILEQITHIVNLCTSTPPGDEIWFRVCCPRRTAEQVAMGCSGFARVELESGESAETKEIGPDTQLWDLWIFPLF